VPGIFLDRRPGIRFELLDAEGDTPFVFIELQDLDRDLITGMQELEG
jgi:hypothetical protein